MHEKIKRDLAKPENEPLFWLLGHASMEGKNNFLVDALLEGRLLVLDHWNKSIAAFRSTDFRVKAASK